MKMKKMLTLILTIMVLLCAVHTAGAAPAGMISVDSFEALINYAGVLLESNHQITSDNLELLSGDKQDSFIVHYSESLALQVSVLHGSREVNQAWIVYLPSNEPTAEEKGSFLSLITELLYATDTILGFDGTIEIMKELDLARCMQEGSSNYISCNHRSIGIAPISEVGFMFSVMGES